MPGPSPQDGAVDLVQRRWKLGLVVLFGLASLALCLWAIAHPPEETDLYLGAFAGVPLSAVLIVLSAVAIVRPGRLKVDEQGVVHSTAFHSRRWAWSDLEGIELVRSGRTTVIILRSKAGPAVSSSLLGRFRLAADDALPGAWPMKTRELFALLTEARARWG